MKRDAMLARLGGPGDVWDIVVVGGGATGIGIAVDAAARGYRILLLEQNDFGKGTSSRSTKLVHGGVRYLEQGNVPLVMQALRERGYLRRNAPHLVSAQAFVIPFYRWWEAPFYGIGLKLYAALAGKYSFGASKLLSKRQALEHLPGIRSEGLRGGVVYYDGQFDDARLLIHLARTAAREGAVLLNYAAVTGFERGENGAIHTVLARDGESGKELRVRARVVVNAAGPFCDAVRQTAEPGASPMLAASQGIHLVFDRSFLPGGSALMVPKTSDGRVMFAIPWHQHTLVGTTDTPISAATLEPVALEQEIAFILATAGQYLSRAPGRSDVLSVFAGIRPLVRAGNQANTAALSRDHTIHQDGSGLLTITGGKWTTYRHMAEDCVDQAARLAQLPAVACRTKDLAIHGSGGTAPGHWSVYGTDAAQIEALIQAEPRWSAQLHPDLPYRAAEVVWAIRFEMARTVEDVLARRLRALFLNAAAARQMAPAVAEILAAELHWSAARKEADLDSFRKVAAGYSLV